MRRDAMTDARIDALVEELRGWGRDELAAIVDRSIDGSPHEADAALAALWARVEDPVDAIGMASIWAPQRALTRAACACVRMILDGAPAGVVRAIEVAEQWTRREVPIEAVWDANREAHACAFDTGSVVAEAATEAAASACETPCDADEPIASAGLAARWVLKVIARAEPARPAPAELLAIIRAAIAAPTMAALMTAFAERTP